MPKEQSGDLRVEPLASAHDRAHFSCGAESLDSYLLVPKYPLVSATLIGRLAVATHSQGRGLGCILLAQALQKAYESASTFGSSMVVVDALDEFACGFYAAHSFAAHSFVRLPVRNSRRVDIVGEHTQRARHEQITSRSFKSIAVYRHAPDFAND